MNIDKMVNGLCDEIKNTEKKLGELQRKRQLIDQLAREIFGLKTLGKTKAMKKTKRNNAEHVPVRIQRLRVLNLLKNEGDMLSTQIVAKIRPDIKRPASWSKQVLLGMFKAGYLSRSLTSPEGKKRRFLYRLGPNASAVLRTNSEPCSKLV
jgi:hypothetical protein